MTTRISETRTISSGRLADFGGQADVVLGSSSAFALMSVPPTQTTEYGAQAEVIEFDPVSLSIIGTMFLTGPYLQRPDYAVDDAAVVSSPTVGLIKQVAEGFFAGWWGGTAALRQAVVDSIASPLWGYPRGNPESGNAAYNGHRGIFAKYHSIVAGVANHVSIRIQPTNQALWLARRPSDFINQDEYGWFATIGAGPIPESLETDLYCGGSFLISGVNRDRDVRYEPTGFWGLERLQYPPINEDDLIQELFDLNDNYHDNLAYALFPGSCQQPPAYYNSNAFAHGLLNAAQLPVPAFPYVFKYLYPGWTTPVPNAYFQK